uniref:Macaca fascicularis brain cDNA clone: QflA-20840, similar to human lipidosin (BG1), mRNA, RefSeq: NM_015162.3 n=1 Tax=Macaca fascicularis TaxID=9541 RepID=I7GIL4_MACFA|nr:unnamed protein product [Macaca fascicularis]
MADTAHVRCRKRISYNLPSDLTYSGIAVDIANLLFHYQALLCHTHAN